MEKINKWLDQFVIAWKKRDVDKVLELFTEDIEYWETPFKRLVDSEELKLEWESVKNQNNINIKCEIFLKEGDGYAVKWNLEYLNENRETKKFGGVYLIKLDADSKCYYFFHCGESDE